MILKNKLTHERVQLSYTEFKTRFAKEIQATLESYVKTHNTIINPILRQMITLNPIFILTYNGTSTILEIQIGILKDFKPRLKPFS